MYRSLLVFTSCLLTIILVTGGCKSKELIVDENLNPIEPVTEEVVYKDPVVPEPFLRYVEASQQAKEEETFLVLLFIDEDQELTRLQLKACQTQGFRELLDRAAFAWVTKKHYKEVSRRRGVTSFPTWVFFDSNHKELGRRVGFMGETDVEIFLNKFQN